MSGNLFKKWLQAGTKPPTGVSLYIERPGARALGLSALKKLVAEHFVGEETIVHAGGYSKSAKIIANSLPTNKRTRSGDLGELLATEYLNSETPFVVPIKKLQMEKRPRNGDARKRCDRGGYKGETNSRGKGRMQEPRGVW